jgi:hypothetical protein
MTFLHISLLAGTALVALPIALHLIMRRRPVRVEFPALRFIERRADANRRRLRLRHLLLLLLQAGAIALLAFALARPNVKLPGAIGSQEAPVAAAMVFDAAPHMLYKHENQTRLEAAKDFGQWLLGQLPPESEIAVLDTRVGGAAAFSPDRGAAKERIARLEMAANSQPLPEALEAAAKLLATSQLPRKEIYIFSDLGRGSWPSERAAAMRQRLAALGGCGVYIVDVGVQRPVNYSLGELRLSDEVLAGGGALGIECEVGCIGEKADRVVELHVLDDAGVAQKRSEQAVEAVPGKLRPVEFRVGGLEQGVRQGFLRLSGGDALAADDARYFSVEVRPAARLLLSAPKPAESYALFLAEALAPDLFRRRGQARFDCDVCDLAELASRPLNEYAAVFVLDPTPLEAAVWKRLADFAAEGRGVAVFLGRNAVPLERFNQAAAQELLPGKLLRQARRPDGETCLAPRDFEHPILSAFRGAAGSIPWDQFPVFRYWELELGKVAAVVLHYSDGRPALVERPLGRGRVLLMTTPVSDRPNQDPWNLLPVGEAWPFVVLANQMAAYLAGGEQRQLNYLAGQTAVLRLDAAQQRRGLMLFAPDGTSSPYPADLSRRELAIAATEQAGNYRLAVEGDPAASLGFSVNYAPEQTRLERIEPNELAGLFAPLEIRMARTRGQIDRDVSQGRVGRELFPALIIVVALVLALESLVANRFYRE